MVNVTLNLNYNLINNLKKNKKEFNKYKNELEMFDNIQKYKIYVILNHQNLNIIRFNLIGSKNFNWKFKINNCFLYKTIFCNYYFINKNCYTKKKCSMAHSIQELKLNLNFKSSIVNFKSHICSLIKFKHNYISCAFSHGVLDYKRPYLKYLNSSLCPNLKNYFLKNYKNKKSLNNITLYDLCEDYLNCKYLHSRIEFIFHPMNKNLKVCNDNRKHIYYLCRELHKNDWIQKSLFD